MALTQSVYTDQTVQQLHTADPIVYWMKNREKERRREKTEDKGPNMQLLNYGKKQQTGDKELSNPSPAPDTHANWFKNRGRTRTR